MFSRLTPIFILSISSLFLMLSPLHIVWVWFNLPTHPFPPPSPRPEFCFKIYFFFLCGGCWCFSREEWSWWIHYHFRDLLSSFSNATDASRQTLTLTEFGDPWVLLFMQGGFQASQQDRSDSACPRNCPQQISILPICLVLFGGCAHSLVPSEQPAWPFLKRNVIDSLSKTKLRHSMASCQFIPSV